MAVPRAPASGVGTLREGDSGAVLRRLDALYKRMLAAADVIAAALALSLVLTLLADRPPTVSTLLLLPPLVLIGEAMGLYYRDRNVLRKTTLDEAPQLFQVTTLYTLLIWLSAGPILDVQLEPATVVPLWVLLFTLVLAGRVVARAIAGRFAPVERCLVLGNASSAAALRRKLEVSFSVKGTIVGRVPFGDVMAWQRRNSPGAPPVIGTLDTLSAALIEHDIQRVIIVPDSSDEQMLEAIRVVKATGVKVSLLPRMLEVVGSSFDLDDVDGITLLGIHSSRLSRSSRFLKRSFDVVGSLTCGVLLAPLLAAIALAIRLTSPGPVLYRQKRIGRGGVEFEMLKFRSMLDGAHDQRAELLPLNETEGLFKLADDPRATRVGRWLRRTSLDELPQLWNVLRGEMSLVGPRPLVPDEDVKIEGWQRKRLASTPGMTGPWQILGSNRVPLEEMVKIDYLYRANWSLWLDAKILVRTVAYVVNRRSA